MLSSQTGIFSFLILKVDLGLCVCFVYFSILDKNNEGILVMNKNVKFVITFKYHRG